MKVDDLQTIFAKTTGIMMELQVLVRTPNHKLDVGFIENIVADLDPQILHDSGKDKWSTLAKEKGDDDGKYEEAIKYYT